VVAVELAVELGEVATPQVVVVQEVSAQTL
jgi:hypothetical protein